VPSAKAAKAFGRSPVHGRIADQIMDTCPLAISRRLPPRPYTKGICPTVCDFKPSTARFGPTREGPRPRRSPACRLATPETSAACVSCGTAPCVHGLDFAGSTGPCFVSRSATLVWPPSRAITRGVLPSLVLALTSAPLAVRNTAMELLPSSAAQWSGVLPSSALPNAANWEALTCRGADAPKPLGRDELEGG